MTILPIFTVPSHRGRRRCAVFLLLAAWLAVVAGVGRAEEDASTVQEPLIPTSLVQEGTAFEMLLPGEQPPAEAAGLLPEPESVIAREVVAPELLDDVSARAADGLRIQEFELDEMPSEDSSGRWFSSGRWYGSAELLMMSRSRNYRRVMGYDPKVVGYPVLSRVPNLAGTFVTTGVPWDLAPAARLTIGEHLGRDYLDRDQSLEFTYYGGLSFFIRDSYNALPGSFLVTPLAGTILPGLPGFTGAQTYESTIGSNYNSMELNYKLGRRLGRDQLIMSPNGGWSQRAERGWLPALLIGTRVANVNETFTFDSSRPPAQTGLFGGYYNIQTQNWLWGLNLGGELISKNEFYYWGLRGRVTPAISFAANQQEAAGINTLPPVNNSFGWRQAADQIGPGFIGDLTLLAGWQVTPNFAVQAGYDFLWVAGIATATRQFNLDNVRPNSIDAGGQAFYNGLSLGIEGSW
ncbi:MAG: hypothetical protein ACKOWG_08110 [Planctomycetia bacterium]